jgi:putative transposase
MESRMLRNGHVRFGGRAGETHQPKGWQGAPVRPNTEHWTGEGKLYLCAIKDVFSNRIVGYSIDSRMKASLAVHALENAVTNRLTHDYTRTEIAHCVVHSDRGSQFRSRKFVRALKRHDLLGSMGRVRTCADSAAMESFFALLQKNVLDRRT